MPRQAQLKKISEIIPGVIAIENIAYFFGADHEVSLEVIIYDLYDGIRLGKLEYPDCDAGEPDDGIMLYAGNSGNSVQIGKVADTAEAAARLHDYYKSFR